MGKTLGYGEITVANMTEPFTVMLTNEAQQFATDSNRKVTSAQSYYTDIIVIRGSQERTDYTIGNITSGSGITVSKTSKRVTFSVSAGSVIGADTGVIEIPITLDGQTVKKQFSWSCGKQGPQGVKGQDGTSVKITSKSVTYQTSTSGTTTPTGVWQSSVPTVANGQYLWTKTTVQYSDGNKTEAYSVSYKGTNGTNGTSVTVSKTEVTYQVSTSGTTAPTGTWSTTMPSCNQGQYLWTKTYVKYSDGKETTSYSVSYKGVDGEKFSWNLINNGKGNEKKGFFKNFSSVNTTEEYGEITLTSKHHYIGIDLPGFVLHPRQYEVGKKVTWSYDIMYTKWDFPTGSNRQEYWIGQRYTGAPSGETATGQWVSVTAHDLPVVGQNGCELNKWFHVEVTKTIPTPASSNVGYQECINFYNSTDISATVTFRMKNVKLEYGDTATPWSPAQSDLEGRGVSQTVQYYLATSQASGVTSSTSGWSTDITTQKLTADKKYLWNCYQTKYSDGTSEPISTPKVIGVYGDKGNGIVASVQRPNKTEFWWSQVGAVGHKDTFDDSSNTRNNCRVGDIFTVMGTSTEGNSHTVYYKSITDSGDLAGECINHVIAESGADAKNLSITPSSQYFKSTDGGKTFAPNTITIKPTIQGEINFGKWQYSIDGGVSFTDVVSGQKGLTISNNVLTVSKDSSLYSDAVTMVTFRAVASDDSFYDTCSIAKIYDVSDIGDGRNLLTGVSSYTKDTPFEKTDSRADGWIVYQNIITSIELEAGKKYVLQAKTDGNWAANHDTSGQDPSKKLVTLWLVSDKTNNCFDMRQGYVVFTPAVTAKYKLRVNQYSNGTDAYTIHLWDIKLEKGSSPTGWTPAPEDVQTAILSTKSEISDVSLKVDNNKQAIEQRVEKTTYERELTLIKGDISKANEGLNKWRYEIYPKSLFASEYQGKSTMDVFAKNTNLTPSQSVLINDTDLSIQWNYAENYIGYALTFTKFSAAKSVAITFAHDDGAHIYLNGKLIGGSDAYSQTGESLILGFVKGWNCIEVVVNDKTSYEGFTLGTTISAISECQLMNCYYGTPVARQSHITNQLVENTTNIEGVTTTMQKVMTTVGGSDRIDEFVNNYNKTIESEKQFKKTIGETYTTKDEFNGLEIGGRNLLRNSGKFLLRESTTGADYSTGTWRFAGSSTMTKSHVEISDPPKSCQGVTGAFQAVGSHPTTSPDGECIGMDGFPYFDEEIGSDVVFSGWARVVGGGDNCYFGFSSYMITFSDGKLLNNYNCIKLNTDGSWTRIVIHGKTTKKADNIYCGFLTGTKSVTIQACGLKFEKGNKATDWTPAPEDNEINGQNLVSNLPSNWEQGTVTEGSAVGTTYANTKSSSAGSIRSKELIPVSGAITISTAYSNQSQKPIRHWIAAYDVNKNYLGVNYVSNSWNSFPRTLDMKDAKYLAIMVGYTDSSAITPSDISKICLKIERGTSATQFTLAPEDVNGKIQSVETIATQTADKFSWLVKSGTSSSNFELTDKTATLVADKINMDGLVTFNGLDSSARDRINTVTSGNLITVTPANPKSDYGGGQTYNVIADDKGGRCVQWNSSCASFLLLNSYTPVNFTSSDQLYYDIRVPNWSSTTFDTKLTIWFYNKNKALITSASKTLTLKSTIWNHFTGYLTLPSSSNWGDLYYYIIGLTNPNKQAIGFTNDSYIEKVNSYATAYAKNAVDWVGQNGTNTNNMYNMVSKWTDGAVSDTTQINGGWIKTNTITANKIAIGDFTNYADINESNTYWFRAEQTKEGTWFYRDGSELQRDNVISELHTCRGGEKFYVEYDISNTIKEGDEYKYAGLMIFGYDGNGGIVSYNRNAGVTATANGEITHITTQLTMPDTTRSFRVYLQIEGHVPFTGTLKIRNISVRKAVTGNLIVDGAITADKIATDAIKSRNYISSGGTQGSFLNLSDGSFKSPNLSWDSNGNLIAKNANLSGQITATDGSIGKFKITDQWLITGSGSTCAGLGGSGQAFWAGAENSTVAPFRVGYDGSFTSSNADISGKITATNGKIGRYDITSTYLMTNSGSNASGIGGNQAFWAGAEDSNSAPFRVGYDGVLWAENAAIRGSIETGNLGDEGDTVVIMNGHIGIQGTSNNVEIYSTGFKFGIDGDYYLESVSDGVKCYRNVYATDLKASGWLYASEVHSSGAVVIASDSESFYWAHGYQIARGTSWGGVCIGDDSQGLRLYGTSIWASHGISTSDENLKENFTTLDQYEDFYMNLNPIGFNYIGDYDGKKTHFGFGAHKTEDILESEGYDSDKFAVVTHRPLVQEDIEKRFGKDVEVDIETEYGISYTEFIALNTHMIQKTRRELTKVKQEKADLEARLQAIEAKLGL